MTEELNLLPCPFCGGTNIVISDYNFRGDGEDQFPQDIVCMDCAGSGFCGHDFKGKGLVGIVSAWNRRAAPAQDEFEWMKGEVARLTKKLENANDLTRLQIATDASEVERLKAENDELRRLNKEANKIITMTNSMHICSPDAATYIDDQNKHIAYLEAQLSAIKQVVDVANPSDSRHYHDCVLLFKADWKAILSAVKDAPAQEQEEK